ncbi:MAG: hypothetical protein ABW110_13520 [Steroidobacteraceae bacterium]
MRNITIVAALVCTSLTFAGAAAQSLTPEQAAAVKRARTALAEKEGDASPAQYTIAAIEAKEWSDSSLGCRTPGAMYQQVITRGYVVLLRAGEQTREVHVAGDHAVVCPPTPASGLRAQQPRVRAAQLPKLESLARQDLAARLDVAIDRIAVIQRVTKGWTQSTLECRGPAEEERAAIIPGFKLYLQYEGRVYTYHTDEARVFACPVIASK